MSTKTIISPALIWLVVLGVRPACSQAAPASGLYQIVSGRYSECCGIGGAFVHLLPDNIQAFIELTIAPQNNGARMRILGSDMQTVFTVPPSGSRPGFTFDLSNGAVYPDRIEFGLPLPNQLFYVVSNSADGLLMSGTFNLPCQGCADVPTDFKHTNVVVVLMPAANVHVSEMEVCWSSVSNRTYQVQYRSALTTNTWTNLGAPVNGNGTTNCVADRLPLGQPQRFYRVVSLP